MPERRKDPSAYAPGPDDTLESDAGETDATVDALTDRDRAESNRAFELLIDAGYDPAGAFQLTVDDDGRAALSLTVVLPHDAEAGDGE